MDGKEAFFAMMENISLTDVIVFLLGACYITPLVRKGIKWAGDVIKKTEYKEEAINNAANLAEYHQQSIDIRDGLKKQIEALQETVNGIIARLDKMEEASQAKELNRMRNLLLQSYQYYTSPERNSTLTWTKMEADTFWALFRDYKDMGGYGYMDSDVEPAMNRLVIIQMSDSDAIQALMQSRR